MRPAWLCDLNVISTTGSDTTIGVAICVTNPNVPLIHAGVLYKDPGEAHRLLHLAFHALVANDTLPDARFVYYWARLPLDADRAAALSGFCRRVAKRSPPIPYGIVYEGGRLAEDGTAELSGKAVGLTCATFVLSVFKSAGLDLLNLGTWPVRKDDVVWHEHIVKMLNDVRNRHPDRISENHIMAVAQESGCARFRPEEVAAACGLRWPVSFCDVELEGMAARSFLLDEVVKSITQAIEALRS